MPDGVLLALGSFTPGDLGTGSGASTTQRKVQIITNLSGEAVRFTINEDIGNLISSATLLLLNAEVSEFGETTSGVYSSGDAATVEEDQAKWGTVYTGATVEPNQMVRVTEIVGSFTTNVVDGITVYTPDEGCQTCTTYWRVVSFTVYENDKNIPYCDIQLESLVAVVLEKTIADLISAQPPVDLFGVTTISYDENGNEVYGVNDGDYYTQQTEFMVFVDEGFFDGVRLDFSESAGIDGYAYAIEDSMAAGPGGLLRFSDADSWLRTLMDVITAGSTTVEGGSISLSGEITGLTFIPAMKTYRSGDEIWKCIEELLAFNRIAVRFKRDLTLVQWSIDDAGFESGSSGEATSIGDYGIGIKGTYTKDNVYNYVDAKGFVGMTDDSGLWKPYDKFEETVHCFSAVANNVLNGAKRQMPDVSIPADYLLKDSEQIKNWGEKELYKSFLQARGISVDSDSIPLNIEVGMSITGSSALFGTVSIVVTTFSRTTDSQAQTVSTSIGGGSVNIVAGDSWT